MSNLVEQLEQEIANYEQRRYQAFASFAPTAGKEYQAHANGLKQALSLVKESGLLAVEEAAKDALPWMLKPSDVYEHQVPTLLEVKRDLRAALGESDKGET